MATLGHAQTYAAAIYKQGGQQLWTRVTGLTEVEWGRKLDDYSEAKITVTKGLSDDLVCGKLGMVSTWRFELAVFRDEELVWIGPIVQKSEFRDRFVFSARDVIAWFDRRYNPRTYFWVPNTSQNPGGWGEGNAGVIARTLLADVFDRNGSTGVRAEHDPNLWAYLHIGNTPAGVNATMHLPQVRQKAVGSAIRDLLAHGLDLYTVGRDVTLMHTSATRAHPPYRLTELDFIGDLEIRESGLDAATRGIVVGGQNQNTGTNGQPAAGQNLPPIGVWGGVDANYGLIEKGAQSQTATTVGAVTALARQLVTYGNPPPVSVVVPQNTQLSPNATIGIHELIPARRLHVRLSTYCTPVETEFVINEVGVTCTANDNGISEQVQVSFTTQGTPLTGLAAHTMPAAGPAPTTAGAAA